MTSQTELAEELSLDRRPATKTQRLLSTVHNRGFPATLVALAIVVIVLVAYPMAGMYWRAVGPLSAWGELFTADWFPDMAKDTTIVVGVSAVVALVFGATLAWINERTDASLGTLGDALPLIPLFLPAVALSVGWVVLASPEVGLLAPILEPLGLQIYSRPGMILVYTLVTVPYTYLPIVAALRSLDPSLEEAARASGASTPRVVLTVSLPAVAPALFSGLILALIIGAGVYSVPAIIGHGTDLDIMSVRIVRSIQNTYPVDYGTAVRLSALLFTSLLVLYYFQSKIIGKQRFAQVGGQASKVARVALGKWRWPLRLLSFGYIALAAVLPLFAIVFLSLQKFWQPDLLANNWTLENYSVAAAGSGGAVTAIRNSVLLAGAVGAVVVIAATMILTYSRHSRNWISSIATGAAKFPAVVPGSVLAVSFIFALGGSPFFLSGTYIIMALAFFVSFLPYATISLEATSAQIDGSLESASKLCGANGFRTFTHVVLPLLRPGLMATFALVFVRIVGDLEVAVLLGTGRTPVVSAVLFRVWGDGFFTQVAAVAVMMTFISGIVVIASMWFSRPKWLRQLNRSTSKQRKLKR